MSEQDKEVPSMSSDSSLADGADGVSSGSTLIEPKDPLPQTNKEQLPESVRQAMDKAGWDELMPVQAKTIPYVLANRDLMVQSRTGSGKTGAFILPIIGNIGAII